MVALKRLAPMNRSAWRSQLSGRAGAIFLTAMLATVFLTGCVSPLPSNVQKFSDVEYARIDGKPLLLDLYIPKQTSRLLPVILWIHGGSWETGSKDHCPLKFMATQDVAVVSFNYRLISEAPFPAQIHDCKGVVRWVRAHAFDYNLDPKHVGVIGVSAGGHLAALLGTTANNALLEGTTGGNNCQSSRVQAVCALYPPTDLNKMVTNPRERRSPKAVVARLLGGPLEGNLDKAALASPATHASRDSSPFFLMHGERDRLVPVDQSILLDEALIKAGVETTLRVIPDKGHGIRAPAPVAREILQFFEKHLR
jgi:acetyl esterase/lipase